MLPRLIRTCRDDRRRKPLAGWEAHGEAGHVGAGERGHETVVGVRRLAEQIVLGGILRRIVQEPQVGVRLVGEERREMLFRHVERNRENRQYAVAHRAERAEIRHHVVRTPGTSGSGGH
jgi:hypothetical protein